MEYINEGSELINEIRFDLDVNRGSYIKLVDRVIYIKSNGSREIYFPQDGFKKFFGDSDESCYALTHLRVVKKRLARKAIFTLFDLEQHKCTSCQKYCY